MQGNKNFKYNFYKSSVEKIWSGRRDSNPQPSAWEADALPLRHTRSRKGTTDYHGLLIRR